jgi:hypothetical protein
MLRIPYQPSLTVLRDFLLQAGYDSKRLASELGLRSALHANLGNLQPLLERTSGNAALPLLARLFFVGWPAKGELCRKYIPEHILNLCLDANILALDDGDLSPSVVIMPFENLTLFAADAPRLRGANPNIVIGPSGTTSILTKAGFRTPTRAVLDIGTGSGVLAIRAAAFSDQVIGTDINERAIEFARFNAALNGVGNVEFTAGDAFAPAEGRQFSRILANPPFFLSAKKHFAYSDSPLELDGFTRKLAMEAPRYLEENGTFQMICEWVEVEGEPWEQRLRTWTAGSGCDVFVFLGPSSTPLDYSENRYHEASTLHTGNVDNLISERLNYLRGHHVRQVMSGVITMRKRKGVNWFATIPGDLTIDAATTIQERMAALTLIGEYTTEQWLRARLRFAPDAAITETRAFGANGWVLTNIEVTKPSGIKDPLKVDWSVLRTIELFDGSNTLAEVIEKTAAALSLPYEDAKSRCLALAKRLVQSSFVLPVASEEDSSQK